jgi:hypothetical protein
MISTFVPQDICLARQADRAGLDFKDVLRDELRREPRRPFRKPRPNCTATTGAKYNISEN